MSGALALLDDCLSVAGIPSSTISAAITRMMDKRHKVLREVIASEFRQGNFERADEDELVSVFYRLIRDTQEGVAKNNLRLMARLINSMAEKQELKAPSFLRYANILASLTDKEMRILAVMVRFKDRIAEPLEEPISYARDRALMEVTTQAEGHLQALLRTGLVNIVTDKLDGGGFDGTHSFRLTKLMDEILRYIDAIPDFTEAA